MDARFIEVLRHLRGGSEFLRARANCENNMGKQALIVALFPLKAKDEESVAGRFFIDILLGYPGFFRERDLSDFLGFLLEDESRCDLLPLAVRAGLSPNLRFRQGGDFSPEHTLLSYVAGLGYIDVARDLIALGANINGVAEVRSTPLKEAIKSERRDMVVFLLSCDADPNFRSPISDAVCTQDPNLVHILTMAGANPNEIDSWRVAQRPGSLETFVAFLDNTSYSPFRGPEQGLVYQLAQRQGNPLAMLMLDEMIKRGATPDLALEFAPIVQERAERLD